MTKATNNCLIIAFNCLTFAKNELNITPTISVYKRFWSQCSSLVGSPIQGHTCYSLTSLLCTQYPFCIAMPCYVGAEEGARSNIGLLAVVITLQQLNSFTFTMTCFSFTDHLFHGTCFTNFLFYFTFFIPHPILWLCMVPSNF